HVVTPGPAKPNRCDSAVERGSMYAALSETRGSHDDSSAGSRPGAPPDAGLQVEFLEKQNHGITSWLVVAPQQKTSLRGQVAESNSRPGFKVFGWVDHRLVAGFLADVFPDDLGKPSLSSATERTQALHDPHRGIFLFYPC